MEVEGENLKGVPWAPRVPGRGNLTGTTPDMYRGTLPSLPNVEGGHRRAEHLDGRWPDGDLRLGAKNVSCVYRRTEAEMLSRGEERKNAREGRQLRDADALPTRII
ncbi:hypothetical protein [Candidatus Amarobacter glycogenicus]|uniref:hypothetical protein n=1 Tax=Candidatus Amarobacter glycogenicus TaxID=3140699 RepID=UPI0031369A4D|nr:hypothetical protein [Dehalococcoidia bacterium]